MIASLVQGLPEPSGAEDGKKPGEETRGGKTVAESHVTEPHPGDEKDATRETEKDVVGIESADCR